jgi:hypothetical protein
LQWLCNGFAIALQWLCSGFAVALQWLCNGFAVALQWLCSGFAVALQWLCNGSANNRTGTAMQMPLSAVKILANILISCSLLFALSCLFLCSSSLLFFVAFLIVLLELTFCLFPQFLPFAERIVVILCILSL